MTLRYLYAAFAFFTVTAAAKSNNMQFKNEIIIQRPVEYVFQFLADFENMPKWNYYVKSVGKLSDSVVGKGTVFHQVRTSDSQDYKIIEFEFPYKVTIETLPPERNLVMRFTLSKYGNGTKLQDEWQVSVPWLVAWAAKGKVKSAVRKNLQKLKILLEEGKVTLQDGRVVTLGL